MKSPKKSSSSKQSSQTIIIQDIFFKMFLTLGLERYLLLQIYSPAWSVAL